MWWIHSRGTTTTTARSSCSNRISMDNWRSYQMATAAVRFKAPPPWANSCCSRRQRQARPVSSTSITTALPSLRACPMAVALAACSRRLWWPVASTAHTTIRLRWVAVSSIPNPLHVFAVLRHHILLSPNRLAAPSTPTTHFYEIQTRAEGRTNSCSLRSLVGWDVDRDQSK